ncbi:L-lysine 6-transaminase [Aestuariimicrobium soli]|uniref:L-lysine 6-transaminase n=1 Tax=Aestuariimicrobium soli TaxID=2035834 RepID=UPI003EBCAABB
METYAADDVRTRLGAHLLVDGLPLVLDLKASRGTTLIDQVSGEEYLDMFTFFASSALGMNHPALVDDPTFREELLEAALNKPSNSDVYSEPMARFVDTFARVMGDDALPHYFFIEGGAAAVENALKVCFDWKSRHNEANGRSPELGTKVMHLEHAFHGRSGYTMSLTNTDPNKVARYPKFPDWPRIASPYVAEGRDQSAVEAEALAQAERAFAEHPHDIACFIAETVQGEGGDHHFRSEFLRAMRDLCHAHDALFVLDEVQTGGGMSGKAWAYQHHAVQPDVVSFGKKLQVCGIMAGGRVDEVPDNVFTVSSRINSTWGGNLTDMVRARRILEVIESDQLMNNAALEGDHLLGRLTEISARHAVASNPRGLGLMCAVTLENTALRDRVLSAMMEEKIIMLGCGERSVRLRPPLTVERAAIDRTCDALDRVLGSLAG